MKTFIFKILLLLIVIAVVDLLFGVVFKKIYETAPSGISYQENFIMRKTNQDLLIFGSSRAAYHYIPEILTDSLNISVYNCGREGSGIYYHYGVLLATLERYKPKVILLDLDYRDIYKFGGIFGLDILKEQYPFYSEVAKEFDSLLVLKGFEEKIKLQSNLYKYNSKAFTAISSHFATGRGNESGFRKAEGIWNEKILPLEANLTVDRNKIVTIQKFIAKAQEHDIKVFIIASPYFMITPTSLYKPVELLASKNDVKFINHVQDTAFINNADLFKDVLHLNFSGAKIFTKKIAGEIKEDLYNQSLKGKR